MSSITFDRQYLVAGSAIVASLPVGCSMGYPSVLLQQLSLNDSSIQMDWDTASWIGSIHGIAGIPSILMPAFMQWKGRKLGFILACLVSIIGWILSYTATSSTFILISESIQGLGSQSILASSAFSLSEMLSPQVRMMTMALYIVTQTLGMALVQLLGSYLHWRTVSVIVSSILVLTTLAACMWPESPPWLACKGEFSRCEEAFTSLRGNSEPARKELAELVLAQEENLSREKCNKQSYLNSYLKTWKRRDFNWPNLHIFVLLLAVYWSGCLAHIIYGSDIIERATHSKDSVFLGNMIFNSLLFVCSILATILKIYFSPKNVLLVCMSWAVVFLLCTSAVNFFQTIGSSSDDLSGSNICLYLLILYMFGISMLLPIALPITAELMPVKYRGLAGPLHVIFTSVLHTTSLKSVPFMLKYFNLWGMLIVFAAVATFCTLFIWKYIPETKGKTLQQLEDYYNYKNFNKFRVNRDNCLSECIQDVD